MSGTARSGRRDVPEPDYNGGRQQLALPIERSSSPRAGTPGPASDPLAELARLIGQNDPFAEFGRDPRAAPRTRRAPWRRACAAVQQRSRHRITAAIRCCGTTPTGTALRNDAPPRYSVRASPKLRHRSGAATRSTTRRHAMPRITRRVTATTSLRRPAWRGEAAARLPPTRSHCRRGSMRPLPGEQSYDAQSFRRSPACDPVWTAAISRNAPATTRPAYQPAPEPAAVSAGALSARAGRRPDAAAA